MTKHKKSIALIPARAGSKRIANKNIKLLNGHPLIAYTIAAAKESNIFDDIFCITDSKEYQQIAKHYGASVTHSLRPTNISGSLSPDIEWVKWGLNKIKENKQLPDIYSILRPTSPFRSAQTIINGYNAFVNSSSAESLRAVEVVDQHPGKMWMIRNNRLLPLMPFEVDSIPWHSSQFANLPKIYIQNASLEFSYINIALEKNTISGESIIPFLTSDLEGFDINTPGDWVLAESYLNSNQVSLPEIQCAPYQ